MYEPDDPRQEDSLAVGKGIVIGVLFGAILWAVIIVGWIYFFVK